MSLHLGLTPTRITASVRIPNTYWEEVWKEQKKPADGSDPPIPSQTDLDNLADQETNKLKEAIVLLLGEETVQGRDPYPKVNISTYWPRTPEVIEGPSMAHAAMAWTSHNWTTLGMIGLTAFGLVMLRSMVKAIPTPEPSTPVASTFQIESGENDKGIDNEPEKPRLRLRKGKSLKDDLGEIVREDPDAAVAILRSWIGNTG